MPQVPRRGIPPVSRCEELSGERVRGIQGVSQKQSRGLDFTKIIKGAPCGWGRDSIPPQILGTVYPPPLSNHFEVLM